MSGLFGRWRHGRFMELLSSYVDGRLDRHQVDKLEEHLAICSACQEELNTLRATVGLLRSLSQAVPMRSFALVKRPETLQATPVYLWGMRTATAVAALALMLLFVGDFLGTFSRESTPATGPVSPATQEEAPTPPPLPKDAEGDRTQRALAAESATPTAEVQLTVGAPLETGAREETLPVTALELILGSLFALLLFVTLLATWRLRWWRLGA